jgi:hypothetical protein
MTTGGPDAERVVSEYPAELILEGRVPIRVEKRNGAFFRPES